MAVVTRRAVLAGGAGAAAVAALGVAASAAASPAPLARTMGARVSDTLVRSRFQPLVGEQFTTDRGNELTLAGIDDLQGAVPGDEFRFNLVFEPTATMDDGIHTLSHPSTHDATLFLSAFGAKGVTMQAVVNRNV